MDELEQLRNELLAVEWADLRAIAERAGVPLYTAYRFRTGRTPSPRYSTVDALRKALVSHRQAA